jgi:hypothetical protein
MRRKVWIGTVLGGLLLLAAPAQAGGPAPRAGATATPAVLTGSVTLAGTDTGFIPVTVTKDMQLGNPFVTTNRGAVTVTGGGEAAGFALIQDGLKGPILLGGRSEAFAPYVKDHGIAVNSLNFNPDDGATFAVPAGDYRLYLITGGKPTTVTLKFIGGTGSSALAPTTKVESVVQQVDLTTPVPGPVGGVYSGGGAVTLTTPVLQFSLNRLDTSVHTESVTRYCYYLGDKPTGPQAYGPACAAPAEGAPVIFDPSPSTFIISAEGVGPQSFYGWNASLTTSTSGEPIRADIANGVNFTTAGTVTSGDYTQYWLSLDGAPAAPTGAAPAPAEQSPDPTPAAGAPTPGQSSPAVAGDQLPATGAPAALFLGPALLVAGAWRCRTRRN